MLISKALAVREFVLFATSSHYVSRNSFLPPKRLTACPLYLSAILDHVKSNAKHSPVPTDFRRAVLSLTKLQTRETQNWLGATREILVAKGFATRFLQQTPNILSLFFFSLIPHRAVTNYDPHSFPPSLGAQPALICHLTASCIIMINRILFVISKRKVQSTFIFSGCNPTRYLKNCVLSRFWKQQHSRLLIIFPFYTITAGRPAH